MHGRRKSQRQNSAPAIRFGPLGQDDVKRYRLHEKAEDDLPIGLVGRNFYTNETVFSANENRFIVRRKNDAIDPTRRADGLNNVCGS